MNGDAIAAALADLKALEFPSGPDDPDLADWIMELLEVDGYYVGLATTAINGGCVSPPSAHELEDLRAWLDQLRVATADDEAILRHCHLYLERLTRLSSVLATDEVTGRAPSKLFIQQESIIRVVSTKRGSSQSLEIDFGSVLTLPLVAVIDIMISLVTRRGTGEQRPSDVPHLIRGVRRAKGGATPPLC